MAVLCRLRQILTALCLLLCLATTVLWVRSYFRADTIHYHRKGPVDELGTAHRELQLGLGSERGRFRVAYARIELSGYAANWFSGVPLVSEWGGDAVVSRPKAILVKRYGFDKVTASTNKVSGLGVTKRTYTIVYVPCWCPALLFGLPPLIALFVRWQRRRRRSLDPDALPCPACGYDLRATPDRCPECGTAVPT